MFRAAERLGFDLHDYLERWPTWLQWAVVAFENLRQREEYDGQARAQDNLGSGASPARAPTRSRGRRG